MTTVTAEQVRNNIDMLFDKAASETVIVESAGKPTVVVMSALEYDRLNARVRKKRVAGTGANLLANLNVKDFLATPIDDDFAGYM